MWSEKRLDQNDDVTTDDESLCAVCNPSFIYLETFSLEEMRIFSEIMLHKAS